MPLHLRSSGLLGPVSSLGAGSRSPLRPASASPARGQPAQPGSEEASRHGDRTRQLTSQPDETSDSERPSSKTSSQTSRSAGVESEERRTGAGAVQPRVGRLETCKHDPLEWWRWSTFERMSTLIRMGLEWGRERQRAGCSHLVPAAAAVAAAAGEDRPNSSLHHLSTRLTPSDFLRHLLWPGCPLPTSSFHPFELRPPHSRAPVQPQPCRTSTSSKMVRAPRTPRKRACWHLWLAFCPFVSPPRS